MDSTLETMYSPLRESQDENSLIVCRICLQEETDKSLLISPCTCKGSMKYVHQTCLNTWRMSSPNPESSIRCDSCKTQYKLKVKGILGTLLRAHEKMPQFVTGFICMYLLLTATYLLKIMELVFKISSVNSAYEFLYISTEKLVQGSLVLGLIGLGPLSGMFNLGILKFPAHVLRLASEAGGLDDERTKIAYATDILISMLVIVAGLYRVVSCVYCLVNKMKDRAASPLSCDVANVKST